MSRMFGNKDTLEEEISEDLLAAIPETEPRFQEVSATPAEEPLRVDVASPDREMGSLMKEVRREMQSVFAKELDRVESSFGNVLSQMDQRLKAADERLHALREEADALALANSRYERKFKALRKLTDE